MLTRARNQSLFRKLARQDFNLVCTKLNFNSSCTGSMHPQIFRILSRSCQWAIWAEILSSEKSCSPNLRTVWLKISPSTREPDAETSMDLLTKSSCKHAQKTGIRNLATRILLVSVDTLVSCSIPIKMSKLAPVSKWLATIWEPRLNSLDVRKPWGKLCAPLSSRYSI